MSKKTTKKAPEKMTNFYEVMDKKFIIKTKNPHYEDHHIGLPFRMIIAGGSGSMKTNTAFNIIHRMPNTFHRLCVITKNKDEPLYNFLQEKIPTLEIVEGLGNAPKLDEFDKKVNSLVIFDDLCLDKDQSKVEAYAIRCRKLGVSTMYLSQSFALTPPTLRKNCTQIILKKISKLDELNRIIRDYSIGIDKKEIIELYKFAIAPDNPHDKKDKTNFFMIDIEADDEYKFRKNLTPIAEYLE
jgi:hypothetical protein